MRIPLDYYRILGVPIQATAQQLSQAYSDRAVQLPRKEYSDEAISSRKRLLDEAHTILSDSEQRSQYDAKFLATTYELGTPKLQGLSAVPSGANKDSPAEVPNPSIWVSPNQLVGALMVLQELGEYELVLKFGKPLLNKSEQLAAEQDNHVDPQIVKADIVLTLALASLELSRELWQQGQYDQASVCGQMGQDLLAQAGLFPAVHDEIKADLHKLRPYCILELLALEEKSPRRTRGLQILWEMLQDRGGIDGTLDDESGLSIDDFLRFIQQLRIHLTAAEQQELFEAEARRPSAVATYLAVYALLGRGFAERKPELIASAKEMLLRLGKRQDVHLEQAVCALLLGQTEEATQALELSQEYEPLAFIREHSADSPDLLPGLCLYGEHWLQTEVFPHFRDLSHQQTSLTEYFADQQVQEYLEQLPVDAGGEQEWSGDSMARVGAAGAVDFTAAQNAGEPTDTVSSGGGVATLTAERPMADRVTQLDSGGLVTDDSTFTGNGNGKSRRRRRSPRSGLLTPNNNGQPKSAGRLKNSGRQGKTKPRLSGKTGRLLILVLVTLLGLGLAGFVVVETVKWIQRTTQSLSGPTLEGKQATVELNQPAVAIPAVEDRSVAADGPLTKEVAEKIIGNWLAIKSEAFGPKYQAGKLTKILAQPMLSTWRDRVQKAKSNNQYRQYQHRMKVESFSYDESSPNQGSAEAAVREVAKAYKGGKPTSSGSYDDNLRVRYYFVKQNGKWLIRDMRVF